MVGTPMEANTASTDELALRTIYVKPVDKKTPKQDVQKIFEEFGRVIRVRQRYDKALLELKDSVYVTFETKTAANAAVLSPPRIPGSSNRMIIMLKAEYEKRNQLAATGGAASDALGKRKRVGSDNVRLSDTLGQSFGPPASANEGINGEVSWKKLAEEYKSKVEELEEELATERAICAQLRAQREQASRSADAAAEREKGLQSQLLRRGVEVAELKGQLAAVKQSTASQVNGEVHTLKAKILDLEVEVQRAKDSLVLEKQRNAPRAVKQFVI
eukprot:jgi/Botrbrau1/14090/Bobra.182_3s0036.1